MKSVRDCEEKAMEALLDKTPGAYVEHARYRGISVYYGNASAAGFHLSFKLPEKEGDPATAVIGERLSKRWSETLRSTRQKVLVELLEAAGFKVASGKR